MAYSRLDLINDTIGTVGIYDSPSAAVSGAAPLRSYRLLADPQPGETVGEALMRQLATADPEPPMTPSADAYALIKRHEGLRLHAYRDPVGIWTIGWGHTGDVQAGDVITAHQAEALLAVDVSVAEAAVRRLVTVPLTQGQWDALVSFTFNLGAQRLKDSTLLEKLNARDYAGAAREFDRWVKGTVRGRKVTLPGLVKRRAEERALFERWVKS